VVLPWLKNIFSIYVESTGHINFLVAGNEYYNSSKEVAMAYADCVNEEMHNLFAAMVIPPKNKRLGFKSRIFQTSLIKRTYMKRSRFTDSQIIAILKEAEAEDR
jgi:hypothetical protein